MAFPLTAFTGTYWRILDGDIYVSSIGNDNTGNGTPCQPYASLSKAITMASTGNKIVVGTGIYKDTINNINGLNKGQVTFCADGIVIYSGSAKIQRMENYSKFIGFQFIDCGVTIFNSIATLENCRFINSGTGELFGGILRNCFFYSGTVFTGHDSFFYNCTFQKCKVSSLSSKKIKELDSCQFGEYTNVYVDSSFIQYFNYCNQEPGTVINIDGTDCNSLLSVQNLNSNFQANGTEVDPVFNNTGMLDYTLHRTSPIINSGRYGQQIGAYGKSFSLHSPINNMNSDIIAGGIYTHVGVETNTGNYLLDTNFHVGTIETNVIDLGDVVVLERIFLYASQLFETPPSNYIVDYNNEFTHPNIVTYQMRYSSKSADLLELPYKEMAWDTIPTVDLNEHGNGELDYNTQVNTPIHTRYIQLLITMKKPDNLLKDPILKGLSMTYSTPNFSIQVQDIYGTFVSGAFITINSGTSVINGITDSQGVFLSTLELNVTYELVISKNCYDDFIMDFILYPESHMTDPNNNMIIFVKDQTSNNPVTGAVVAITNGSIIENGEPGMYEGNIDSSYDNTITIEKTGYQTYQNSYQQFITFESLIPGFRIVPVIFLNQI
jgi:hypothetical protein